MKLRLWLTRGWLVLVCMASPVAQAQTLTLVVPFAPGGGTDSLAREIGKKLGDILQQPVVIDNRGGGGGVIGAQAVARATPNGNTLLFATSTLVTSAVTEAKLPYRLEQDFAPVAMIGRGPLLLVASPTLGVQNWAQLKSLAQTAPQGLTYCSAGLGSINHLSGELFRQQTHWDLVHVPYKGSGPATVDLLAGRVDLFFATVPTIYPYVKDARVQAIAVTSAQRSALFPELPTLVELGWKDLTLSTWWGVLAPAHTPSATVERLNRAIAQAVDDPAVKERLKREGAERLNGSPADFQRALTQELAMWQQVVKRAGLKLDN